MAPKTPVSTVSAALAQRGDDGSTSGSATAPGRRGRPGRPAALAGVAVQRELADHEQRRAGVGARLLVAQDAQLGSLRAIVAAAAASSAWVTPSRTSSPASIGADDLAVHGHRRRQHPRHHRPHARPACRSAVGLRMEHAAAGPGHRGRARHRAGGVRGVRRGGRAGRRALERQRPGDGGRSRPRCPVARTRRHRRRRRPRRRRSASSAQAADALGGLDVLVNNAGVYDELDPLTATTRSGRRTGGAPSTSTCSARRG